MPGSFNVRVFLVKSERACVRACMCVLPGVALWSPHSHTHQVHYENDYAKSEGDERNHAPVHVGVSGLG